MADQESTQGFIRITYYHGLLIAGGFTILGGLIGAWLHHYFAGRRDKTNKRLDASTALYETFRTTIRELEKEGGLDTQAIVMSSALGKQVTEVERFRFHLSKRKRKAFIIAWDEYHKKGQTQEFTDNGQKDKRAELRKDALNHIYKVLKFAGYERHN